MTKVLVLSGGDSPEREVSLRSGRAVIEAAKTAGFDVSSEDPQHGFDFLDNYSTDTVVLPILHGAGGEDGVVQAELERRGFKYLGADSKASQICFDKDEALKVFKAHGIPTAEGVAVSEAEYATHPLANKPHVLKVARGGSSIGTLLVRNPEAIDSAKIKEVFERDDKAILEELVVGVEVTVPILGSEALPVIEIRPPENGEFDYENKYNGKTAELCPPQNVSEELQQRAQQWALKAHVATGCRHLSRTDIIIRDDGSMALLEVNTIPGLTDQSLVPKSAAVVGLDMPRLVARFVELAQA